MALTQTQVSQLYVSIFNRASEGEGNKFWQTSQTAAAAANDMLDSQPAKDYFGTAMDDNQAFIKHIYKNTLNKTYADDKAGIDFWTAALDAGTSRGEIVAEMIKAISSYSTSTDPVTKAAYDQFNNRVEVSNYMANTVEKAPADYKTTTAFATSGTTGLVVTNNASTVTTAKNSVQALTIDGKTFTLTTGADTIVGTALSDLIDGSTKGTLNDGDVILDATSTDNDILNATVTSSTVAARIQNIETVNVTGEYVTTGLKLTNVTGTKNLNVDTNLSGGTAKVTDANTIAVENINASANISKLEVTSLSSGTRDTVSIDASSANVTLTGSTAADKYSVTMAADTTLTTDDMKSASDALTVNLNGDLTLVTEAVVNAELGLTLVNNATTASTVTATNTGTIAKTLTLSGNDIVVDADDGVSISGTDLKDGTAVTSDAASSTIELSNDNLGTVILNRAVVDTVLVSGGKSGLTSLIVNEATKVVLAEGVAATTLNIENAAGDMATSTPKKTGTLLLDVNATQSNKITTGAEVDTVLLTAGALENDANGNAQTVTMKELDTAALGINANVVLTGANDLVLTKWTNDADTILNAAGMTGDLTLGTAATAGTTKSSIIILGNGTNTVFAGAAGENTKITGGTGVDKITLVASTTGINTIDTGAGDDVITTGATGTNNITVGAGNDIVNITAAATVDTITLGSGNNTVNLEVVESETTIKNLNAANDTIVLMGTATTDVNLTNVTPTTGAYKVSNTALAGVADFTLTGSTATNISAFVQLGSSTIAFTAAAGLDVIAGAKDDVIAVDGANNITTGAGEDTIVVATTEKTATVTDFTVGSDKVVLTGAAADSDSIDLNKVVVSSGKLTLSTNHEITLKNGGTAVLADGTGATAKDASAMVQLGNATTAFDVDGTGAAISVTGGQFDDFINVANSTKLVTINFTDNGGMDTITNFTTAQVALTFGNITGITAASTGFDLTAKTAATKATSGEVYVLASNTSISGDTIDFSKVNGTTVKVTDDAIVADIVGYLNNALSGVQANHTYVAVIQDNDNTESYAYLINATSTAITADDITLIGCVDATVAATDVVAI